MNKHENDLRRVKEIVAELQIYVQQHNVKFNTDVVDNIKLNVTMESMRNEMEERFDATFSRFELIQNQKALDFVTNDEVNKQVVRMVQKR